jgi:predicted transcriptional regulator
MVNETHLSLQHSESVVANMAATIFAAYVQSGKIDPLNEEQYLKKAVHMAVKLATHADKIVKSDTEWMKQQS